MMKVLVACEFSAVVRDAFRKRGHDAWSCDLLPCEGDPAWHIEGDVRGVLNDGWDLLIAHPPCTYLSVSGIHWNERGRGWERTEEALGFVRELLAAPVHHICLENPVSIISSRIRKPDQIIQPHQFGQDASKATCLWLKNLPPLVPTAMVAPRIVNGRKRWGNQCDSGQNKLGPSEDRWKLRSATYHGIAEAMATQWGSVSKHFLNPTTNSVDSPANPTIIHTTMSLEDQLKRLNENLERLIGGNFAPILSATKSETSTPAAPAADVPAETKPKKTKSEKSDKTEETKSDTPAAVDRPKVMNEIVEFIKSKIKGSDDPKATQAKVAETRSSYGVELVGDLPDDKLLPFLADIKEALA